MTLPPGPPHDQGDAGADLDRVADADQVAQFRRTIPKKGKKTAEVARSSPAIPVPVTPPRRPGSTATEADRADTSTRHLHPPAPPPAGTPRPGPPARSRCFRPHERLLPDPWPGPLTCCNACHPPSLTQNSQDAIKKIVKIKDNSEFIPVDPGSETALYIVQAVHASRPKAFAMRQSYATFHS